MRSRPVVGFGAEAPGQPRGIGGAAGHCGQLLDAVRLQLLFEVLHGVGELDWQGAESVRLALGNRCVSVFMLPPSMTELERRIRARAQDSDTTIKHRLAKAEEEISHWHEFDYVIVNHDLDTCVEEIRSVVRVEQIRRRGKSIGRFIETMLRT